MFITSEVGLSVGHVSHRGQVRAENEDNYCILLPPDVAQGIDALLAVADGMGGHQAGEVASAFVVQTLAQLFSSLAYREWVDYSPQHEDYNVIVLKEVLERLNESLYSEAAAQSKLRGMGTTATVALLVGRVLFIGHVGDSRAYLLCDGGITQLTQDHSWVAEQVRDGTMTPQEAERHPRKNILTRCLGNSLVVRVDRFSRPVLPGDCLVLCTDGLSNMVSDGEIAQVVLGQADPQRACDQLVELANARGGLDNITVVVARVVEGAGQPKPATGKVLGHIPGADRAAITQKIVRQAVEKPKSHRLKPRVSWAASLVVASLILGAGIVTVAVARSRDAAFIIQRALVPPALWGVLALLMMCAAVLLLIGIKMMRR
jgi:serine/threonine protein phosphatase PrpC